MRRFALAVAFAVSAVVLTACDNTSPSDSGVVTTENDGGVEFELEFKDGKTVTKTVPAPPVNVPNTPKTQTQPKPVVPAPMPPKPAPAPKSGK